MQAYEKRCTGALAVSPDARCDEMSDHVQSPVVVHDRVTTSTVPSLLRIRRGTINAFSEYARTEPHFNVDALSRRVRLLETGRS